MGLGRILVDKVPNLVESMEKHVQIFINKLSFACIAIATFTTLLVFLQIPTSCFLSSTPSHLDPKRGHQKAFPASTCDYNNRIHTPLEKRNKRLWYTKTWVHNVQSYISIFSSLQALARARPEFDNFLANHSRALVVSAGGGQPVMALMNMGVHDVTGVEVVESLPLVSRADPHNLPFFDHVFDIVFSGFFDRALFPVRHAWEMERSVRVGGVEECGDAQVKEILQLFMQSQFVDSSNVSIAGERRTRILLRKRETISPS